MQHCYIKDIAGGDLLKGIYIVGSAHLGTTQKNDPYWSLKIADSSGQADAKIWSPLATSIKELKSGSFISVEGKGQVYKDSVQFVLSSVRILEEDEVASIDLTPYVATSPRPLDDMIQERNHILDTYLTYTPWKEFVHYVLNDARIAPYFDTAPAAKSMHHAYMHGLLEHSLNVCKNCLTICALYPQLDKQTLIVAALFHDIGKIEELSGVLATEYTPTGKLLGHTIIGLTILEPYFKKAQVDAHLEMHLKHLIISHHGELEFGAPKTPATAEAWILHYADNIDAKVNQALSIVNEAKDHVAWLSGGYNRQFCRIDSAPIQQETESTHSPLVQNLIEANQNKEIEKEEDFDLIPYTQEELIALDELAKQDHNEIESVYTEDDIESLMEFNSLRRQEELKTDTNNKTEKDKIKKVEKNTTHEQCSLFADI